MTDTIIEPNTLTQEACITLPPNTPGTPTTVSIIDSESNPDTHEWQYVDQDGNTLTSDTLKLEPSASNKNFYLIVMYGENYVDCCCIKTPLSDDAKIEPDPHVSTSWPPENTNHFTSLPNGYLCIISGTSEDDDNIAFGCNGIVLDPSIKIGGGTIPD